MIQNILSSILIMILVAGVGAAQGLSVKWEELTAPDFIKGIQEAKGTCLLPMSAIEKHGPHAPMGTDMFVSRYIAINAAKQEYAIVFPEYYAGEMSEAKHQPGSIAYSGRLLFELLGETISEMARNGCKKIIILPGHGGNTGLVNYFMQTQLDSPKDYVVYLPGGRNSRPAAVKQASTSTTDGHAGEGETSDVMVAASGLVKLDQASSESGADQNRLKLPAGLSTSIWWYASFPNHYQGNGSGASSARGEKDLKPRVDNLANLIRWVKADQITPKLQKQYLEETQHPIDTRQKQ